MKLSTLLAILACSVLAPFTPPDARAQAVASAKATNVVLVHGAWADASSWAEVIPYLQAAGLKVTAVENPLTSLKDSLEATRHALALQDGPTVLAAHSWGGTVISELGLDQKVTALVYIAARAPDAREDFVALSASFPQGPVRDGIEKRPSCRRTPSSNTSPMASMRRRQMYSMPPSRSPPPRFSRRRRRWLHGTANPPGMLCRSKTRPSTRSCSDFLHGGWARRRWSLTPAICRWSPTPSKSPT
jgi:pimeloyl-ACP methyl ester carboxylesterase